MSHPPLLLPPRTGRQVSAIGRLIGGSLPLALLEFAQLAEQPLVVFARNPRHADQLEAELRFFSDTNLPVEHFVDWETLPYDTFSPHQDIVSRRLKVLSRLPEQSQGITVVSLPSLLERLPPREYVGARSLHLKQGQRLERDRFIQSLSASGYRRVPQVEEHGEFAVRGALFDLFPMGSERPVRVDLFDEDIDSLRYFDPDTQVSADSVDVIDVLPASEIPLDEASIKTFRHSYRARFEGQPSRSRVYSDISNGISHGGIEYYLPLFFDESADFLDYLPEKAIIALPPDADEIVQTAWDEVSERYDVCRHDVERPVLRPSEAFYSADVQLKRLQERRTLEYHGHTLPDGPNHLNVPTQKAPAVRVETRYADASAALTRFMDGFRGRVLFTADSPGKRETVLDFLRGRDLDAQRIASWAEFLTLEHRIGVTVAPLEDGVVLSEAGVALIAERQLFGDRPGRKRRRRADRDPESIIRQLDDLQPGSPVVHEEYGVGRYLGLVKLEAGGSDNEFLMLEYAEGDKLYVPVHALEVISRYTGASAENAPLHRLGSDQWAKAKRRAIKRIRDVAAELLDVYARRAARKGDALQWAESDYRAFEAGFPYEPTEDQQQTIDDVLDDLRSAKPMDRVVCGDVGFGKTEVALRASFAATHAGKQVAVLVPTTLLAQQHGQTFKDRFADWPVKVEVISRFRSRKDVETVVDGLRSGGVDIVIGTHRLLQHVRELKNIGLVIIDEEHRFGVRHKEAIKSLKSNVDALTLTATPIPRTLNMALGGLREMSLIATPPAERLAVKTFVGQWNDVMIREACLREIKRGGQVYFVHNRVGDIEDVATKIEKLVPEAKLRIGHGQMPERELESVMLDFYHRRFNVLVCTTIVESGIDVPTANTIIINRADRFGLAQLHQLRGRVGRSHHRAYAYLIAPPQAAMTADAVKRLEAIDSLEDLGSGFVLATHDLEIRGAGELLGEAQSGQIHEIGFALYMELLERTIAAMKAGREPQLEQPLDTGVEINLHAPALLPEDYVPDVHLRLILYKRISGAPSPEALRDLQVELIDRFGLLPDSAKMLLRLAETKLSAQSLGIEKIDVAEGGGYLVFGKKTQVDPATIVAMVQNDPKTYRLRGAERLSFTGNWGEPSARVDKLDNLLERLGATADSARSAAT